MQPIKFVYHTVAFALEIAMVVAFFRWGYAAGATQMMKYVCGIGIVTVLVTYWGIFQSPKAVFRLGFPARTIVEIVLFSTAVAIFYATGNKTAACVFAIAAVFKEILSVIFKGA